MRAPTFTRHRRPVVDELDNHPTILPPLDRPFDHILATTSRLRTEVDGPLTRQLLRSSSTTLPFRRSRFIRDPPSRKTIDDNGLSAQLIRTEMLSCDGGSLDFDDSGRYNAENLLVDNSAVYCTAKLENVNILLRGAGSRPFTLSKIVIKAPQRSFTSPVKDGLVFVSMDRIDISETKLYDRSEPGSESSFGKDVDCDSDLQRLLEGQELPCTTTCLEDRKVHKDIIRPQAYFVVDERQGSATIEFMPPLSGRYVHVKLLSGQPFDSYPGRFERDNIDVQAILLYGYGRRQFPSYELR